MNFLSPIFLWALGGIAVPVLIHFFGYKKKKNIPFSYIKFLKLAKVKSIRIKKLKETLILILRTLIIVFILFALSDPITKAMSFLKEKNDVIILLDNSASMRAKNNKVWKRAIKTVEEILGHISGNSRVALILSDNKNSGFLNQNEIKKYISGLSPSFSPGNINQSFRIIKEITENKVGKKLLFIISDMQKNLWENLTENLKAEDLEVFVVDVGEETFINMGLKDIKKVGQDKYIFQIVNWSTKEQYGEIVVFSQNYQGRKNFYINPLSEEKISFEVKNAGEIEVKINREDDFDADNVFYFCESQKDKVKVMIVTSSTESSIPLVNVMESLKLEKKIDYKIVEKENLNYENLTGYDFIFIVDAGKIKKESVERIEKYLKNGGNLVLIPGDRDIPENFNYDWKDLLDKSLIPAILVKKENLGKPLPVNYINEKEKIFQGIESDISKYFSYVRFNKLFTVKILSGNVILESEYKYPLIISRYTENGNVLFFCFSLKKDWTNFPYKSFFPVFVDRIIENLKFNYIKTMYAGEKFYMEFPEVYEKCEIVSPEGKIKKIEGKSSKLEFEMNIPGIWQLNIDTGKEIIIKQIPVNFNYVEGNLVKISERELRKKFNFPFRKIPHNEIGFFLKKKFSGHHLKGLFILLSFTLFLMDVFITDYYIKKND